MRRRILPALVVAATLALGGCGVPADPGPRGMRLSEVPSGLTKPRNAWTIYYLKESKLAPVQRTVDLSAQRLTTLRSVMAELLKAPTNAERDEEGYYSDLEGASVVVTAVTEATATVELGSSGIEQDGIGIGQIVLTLTENPQITRVEFTVDGKALTTVRNPAYDDIDVPVRAADFEEFRWQDQSANLYFVRDGKLVSRIRAVSGPETGDTVESAASKLLEPLTNAAQAEGFDSYVNAQPALSCDEEVPAATPDSEAAPSVPESAGVEPVRGEQAGVDAAPVSCAVYGLHLDGAFATRSRAEQVLAIGQILFTVEGWALGTLPAVNVYVGDALLDEVPVPDGTHPNPVDKSLYIDLLP